MPNSENRGSSGRLLGQIGLFGGEAGKGLMLAAQGKLWKKLRSDTAAYLLPIPISSQWSPSPKGGGGSGDLWKLSTQLGKARLFH